MRHPTTRTWVFPPPGEPDFERINLRELAARPERFEHHLIVVARIGTVQLELATATEPLYFAHVNISDEYAVALPTGDPLLDAFPLRTFVNDRNGADIGRYNHKAGDLVLHPVDYLHWPGKLRPPYEGIAIPPGMRRAGLSLVYCASVPTPSNVKAVSVDSRVKYYVPAGPPLELVDLLHGLPLPVASVGSTKLELVIEPSAIVLPQGGWVVVLVGDRPCELIRVPAGFTLPGRGITRALVFSGDTPPDAVPTSWTELPPAPFPPFEDAPPGELPFEHGELRVEADGSVRIADSYTTVPRYWLARMLFRVALHDYRLNYVETYGTFYVDDHRIGIRGTGVGMRGGASMPHTRELIERLYRAVAPPGYVERLV
jgi:hypothetical protein